MMKKITLLLCGLLTVSLGYSQQTILEDFEGAPPTFLGFEGLGGAAIVDDPVTGSGNKVFELISSSTGQGWQGAEVIMQDNFLDLTTDKTVKVKVYSTVSFNLFSKVEDKVGPASPASAASTSYVGGSGWQELTVTFNESLDGTAPANGEYTQIAFFPNWKTGGGWNTPPGNFTIYVDDITAVAGTAIVAPSCTDGIQNQGETGVDCGGPCTACATDPTTAAPTPPARNPGDVVSIYSGAYAAITPINYDLGWCGTGAVTATMVGGDEAFKYNGNNCQGIGFPSALQNVTGLERIHVDLFIQAGTDLVGKVFNMKIVPSSGTESEFNIDFGALAVPPVPGTWFSYDAPISFGTNPTVDIKEFGVTSNLHNVLWYDNMYMYKGVSLSTKDFEIEGLSIYPNPTESSWNVQTKNIKMSSIQVFDILGKNVLTLTPNAVQTTIDGSSLKSGLYFARVKTATGTSSLKLVKK